MTVAIGLVCSDGVVVAADSMASDGLIANVTTKVHKLESMPLVWTASGPVYVIEEVQTALSNLEAQSQATEIMMSAFTEPRLQQVRQNLGQYVREAMKSAYESALPLGGNQAVQTKSGSPRHVFATDLLFAGYANGQAYLLEVAGDGQMNWHTAERFYAVGSGGEFASVARAVMAHYIEGEEPLSTEAGLQFAYRAIETTCKVSSSSVGLPVQLAVSDESGTRILVRGNDEWEEVREGVNGWVVLERDSLGPRRAQEGVETEPPTLEE